MHQPTSKDMDCRKFALLQSVVVMQLSFVVCFALEEGSPNSFAREHATYAATQQFEVQTFYVMRMFQDMLPSAKSANIS